VTNDVITLSRDGVLCKNPNAFMYDDVKTYLFTNANNG